MMAYETFVQQFATPQPNTAVPLDTLGLEGCADLARFVAEVGAGVFAHGFASIASRREHVGDLGGWEHWLPQGARMFACGAFGTFFATRGEDVWVVNTQYGEVMESDLSVEEAILDLASPETREDIMHESIFHLWHEVAGPLPVDSVLCPTPALALGGTLAVTDLSVMPIRVYLSFMAQIFAPGSQTPVRITRLGD